MIKFSIVLVAFPFDDLTTSKVRPALCLTDELGPYSHTIVAFISSNTEAYHLDSDIVLAESFPGFSETGLKITSIVRLHRLVTIPASLIKRRLGWLPQSSRQHVYFRIMDLFKP